MENFIIIIYTLQAFPLFYVVWLSTSPLELPYSSSTQADFIIAEVGMILILSLVSSANDVFSFFFWRGRVWGLIGLHLRVLTLLH